MIVINIDKAKNIAHEKRRDVRAKEFAPLDVQATIPSMMEAAESARQIIREKHAKIQLSIDAAVDVDSLKTIIDSL